MKVGRLTTNNLLNLNKNLKRKMIKFDFTQNKLISHDINLNDFFTNKKILMIYPYPSKERLNSELYDDILNKLKLAKEIENNDKDINNKYYNKTANLQERREMFGIFKTKYLNQLDEIVGLSQMNENKTEEYVEKMRIPDVWFIVDESNFINNHNKFHERYEVLIDNMKIVEYRPDPTLAQNIYIGTCMLYLVVVFAMVYLGIFFYCLNKYGEREKRNKLIYNAIN